MNWKFFLHLEHYQLRHILSYLRRSSFPRLLKCSFFTSLLYIYIYKYVYFSLHKSRTNVSSLSRVSYRGWNVVKRYQPMYLWGGICVAEKIG